MLFHLTTSDSVSTSVAAFLFSHGAIFGNMLVHFCKNKAAPTVEKTINLTIHAFILCVPIHILSQDKAALSRVVRTFKQRIHTVVKMPLQITSLRLYLAVLI